MKKYTKPVAEIEIFESTDIITVSGTNVLDPENFDTGTAEALGLS